MTNSDLGLASAYIDGDFSFVDKDKGLQNFILVNILIFIFANPVFFDLFSLFFM